MTAGQTKEEIKVSHYQHGKNEYSLSLDIDNKHVSLSSAGYTHKPGNFNHLVIFDMSTSDMMALAEKIQQQVLEIKTELNKELERKQDECLDHAPGS